MELIKNTNYSEETHQQGGEFLQILLTAEASWKHFEVLAGRLEQKLNIKFSEQIDGLDERSWDFDYDGALLTLHLQKGEGIIISSRTAGTESDKENLKIAQLFEAIQHFSNRLQ